MAFDEQGLPVDADQIEHQRDAIGIAGLGEAAELVFSHEREREPFKPPARA